MIKRGRFLVERITANFDWLAQMVRLASWTVFSRERKKNEKHFDRKMNELLAMSHRCEKRKNIELLTASEYQRELFVRVWLKARFWETAPPSCQLWNFKKKAFLFIAVHISRINHFLNFLCANYKLFLIHRLLIFQIQNVWHRRSDQKFDVGFLCATDVGRNAGTVQEGRRSFHEWAHAAWTARANKFRR